MARANEDKRWINPDRFYELFDISKSTQNRMRMEGILPYTKLGGFVFYDRDKIDALFETHDMKREAAS